MTRSTRSNVVTTAPSATTNQVEGAFKWIGPGVKANRVVHYSKCVINRLHVSVGDNVEIQLDKSSAFAQVRDLFETIGDDPFRATVRWYYPMKDVPKRYHSLIGKASSLELFQAEDGSFVGSEEEIDAETIGSTVTVLEIGENDTPTPGEYYIRYCFPSKSKGKLLIPILERSEPEEDTRVFIPNTDDVTKGDDVTAACDIKKGEELMMEDIEEENVVTKKKNMKVKGQQKTDVEAGDAVKTSNEGVSNGKLKESAQKWKNFSADEVLAELWKTDKDGATTNTSNKKTNLKRKLATETENKKSDDVVDDNIPLSEYKKENTAPNAGLTSVVNSNKQSNHSSNLRVDKTIESDVKTNSTKNLSPFRAIQKRKESNAAVSVFDFDESAEMAKKVLKKKLVADSALTKSNKNKKSISVKTPKNLVVEESGGDESGGEESGGEDEGEWVAPKTPKTLKTPKVDKKKSKNEATPGISERKTPRAAPKNMLELARKRLHVSAVPDTLPCRDEQFEQIFTFVQDRLQEETGGCMYISGVPGTGKTATVREVVRVLKESVDASDIPDFKYIEINGMKLTDPNQAYVEILKALEGKKATPDHAADLLTRRFQSGGKNENVVLLVDELDLLCTRKQNVMYNMFDWPTYRHSKLVVLAVANTMDLPERMMMNRVSSRLGLTRMTFQPYTFKQLEEIVVSRIRGTNAFEDDALQLVARKVAAVSGDARRCLDICRRAVEIGEMDVASVKKVGNSKASSSGIVGMKHVDLALREMFSSPKIVALRCLSGMERMFMKAVISEFRRTGLEEAIFLEVYDQFKKHCALEDGVHPPNMSQAFTICNNLGTCRLLLVETGIKDVHQRVRLNVNIDDVMFAFKSRDSLT